MIRSANQTSGNSQPTPQPTSFTPTPAPTLERPDPSAPVDSTLAPTLPPTQQQPEVSWEKAQSFFALAEPVDPSSAPSFAIALVTLTRSNEQLAEALNVSFSGSVLESATDTVSSSLTIIHSRAWSRCRPLSLSVALALFVGT